jgi:AraC family transcriptional regulator
VTPLAIEGLTLELLAETSRRSVVSSNHKRPLWLEQAREILHAHFTGQLTLTSIAEMVGVHPVHLAREFRKYYLCTMGDYVRQLRIEFACRNLAETTTPLVEIALAAGFSHQSHFSRTFKRLTGMTPAQYRALSRLR